MYIYGNVEMLEHVIALDKIFNMLNGEDLYISENYLTQHMELASAINCDDEIKKLFFKSRMYFRIQFLNSNISNNIYAKKRKINKTLH